MPNGNVGESAIAASLLGFLKGKIATVIVALTLSTVSFFGSYKVFAYRIEQHDAEIQQLKKDTLSRPEAQQAHQQVVALIETLREEIKAEGDTRQGYDELILEEIHRANDRIDKILQRGRQ